MRKIIYSAYELRQYPHPRRELLGEEELDISQIIRQGESHPGLRDVFERYGTNVVIGPVVTKRGTEKKGSESRIGVYNLYHK